MNMSAANDLSEFVRSHRAGAGVESSVLCERAELDPASYLRFEAGDPSAAHEHDVVRIARALRLDATETRRLLDLAERALSFSPARTVPFAVIPPHVVRLVQALDAGPAYVMGPRWDVYAWNLAYDVAFAFGGATAVRPHNVLWSLFMDERSKDRFPAWPALVRRAVAMFRVEAAAHVGNPDFSSLIASLRAMSPAFEELWQLHETVDPRVQSLLELEHPTLGRVAYRTSNFALPELPDFTLVIHVEESSPRLVLSTSPRRERLEQRLETLLEASLALGASLDFERTVENVVRFVATRFASYALLDVVAPGSEVFERVAVAHGDPAREALVEGLASFVPPRSTESRHPVVRAIAHERSTLELVDEAYIAAVQLSEAHGELLRALEPRAALVVPVVGAQGVIGALTCVLDEHAGRPPYDSGDIAFAEELGRRAGIAIDHARLYERERRIAITLQDASLPATLPALPEVALDAAYRPGRSEATIGGDWYDAFALADGRLALTIGDVLGNGLRAAVTMTKLRQAMQAAAMLEPSPAAMLDVADRTLRLHDADGLATALAAIYDPRERTLALASAGHAAPHVRTATGRIGSLASAGAMLGLGIDERREIVTFPIEAGSTVVFYTDGLVESTHDFAAGEAALRAALAFLDVRTSASPAAALVEAVLGSAPPTDDVAVLIASFA